jgi:hypothetical protein
LASTAKLLGLIELAYLKYGIEENRMLFWTQLIFDTRELIKKWRQKDKERYCSIE